MTLISLSRHNKAECETDGRTCVLTSVCSVWTVAGRDGSCQDGNISVTSEKECRRKQMSQSRQWGSGKKLRNRQKEDDHISLQRRPVSVHCVREETQEIDSEAADRLLDLWPQILLTVILSEGFRRPIRCSLREEDGGRASCCSQRIKPSNSHTELYSEFILCVCCLRANRASTQSSKAAKRWVVSHANVPNIGDVTARLWVINILLIELVVYGLSPSKVSACSRLIK